MRWLAVFATSIYILTSDPGTILSAAEVALPPAPGLAPQEAQAEAAKQAEAVQQAAAKPAYTYRSDGRRDPFESLVKEKPKIKILTPQVEADRPRGSLERFDISALKLVGIVWGELGRRGLIRAPDNKGYFVTVGTYMGENGGQVVDVAPDRLIIEEKYKDTEGNTVGKTLDLPLRRKEKEQEQ